MPDREQAASESPGRLRVAMLQETYNAALEAAGHVWPTPAMALASLFERGVLVLEGGTTLPPLTGQASSAALTRLNQSREDLFLVDAQYPLTRYVAFASIQGGASFEATWIALADRHLEIRAQIVEARRYEEKLKRELILLGGASVPLPEHDDLPAPPPDRPRKSQGMFSRMFADAEIVEPEFDVAPPLARLADGIVEANGWTDEWGKDAWLLLVTHGLSLVMREREAESINLDDDGSVDAAYQAVRARLMGLEGRYSTLRRRLFEVRHNNRILQWRITALEIEAQGMRSRLDQFLADRERLEREIADRRANGAVIPEATEAVPESRTGWRQRISRLLGASD
jgi:hypothetical protein